MPLPKIDYPINEVYLKSLDRKMKFRPFCVREEKLLLIAKESDDVEDVKTTIKQVIQNCCLEAIDVDSLPLFDIEMFFVHLRSRSLGSQSTITFTCQNVVDDAKCGHITDYDLNLDKVQYIVPENHMADIKVGKTVGLKLKYPTLEDIKGRGDNAIDSTLTLFMDNVEYIYDSDSVYKREDMTKEDLETFFDQLSIEQVEAIRTFFITRPKVVLKEEIVCAKCGFHHDIVVENLHNFFI